MVPGRYGSDVLPLQERIADDRVGRGEPLGGAPDHVDVPADGDGLEAPADLGSGGRHVHTDGEDHGTRRENGAPAARGGSVWHGEAHWRSIAVFRGRPGGSWDGGVQSLGEPNDPSDCKVQRVYLDEPLLRYAKAAKTALWLSWVCARLAGMPSRPLDCAETAQWAPLPAHRRLAGGRGVGKVRPRILPRKTSSSPTSGTGFPSGRSRGSPMASRAGRWHSAPASIRCRCNCRGGTLPPRRGVPIIDLAPAETRIPRRTIKHDGTPRPRGVGLMPARFLPIHRLIPAPPLLSRRSDRRLHVTHRTTSSSLPSPGRRRGTTTVTATALGAGARAEGAAARRI